MLYAYPRILKHVCVVCMMTKEQRSNGSEKVAIASGNRRKLVDIKMKAVHPPGLNTFNYAHNSLTKVVNVRNPCQRFARGSDMMYPQRILNCEMH